MKQLWDKQLLQMYCDSSENTDVTVSFTLSAHNVLAKESACPGKTHSVLQMSAEAAAIPKHAERRLRAGTPGVFCGAAQVSVEHRLQTQTRFKQG